MYFLSASKFYQKIVIFCAENEVIIFCASEFETIDINAVLPLGKVRCTPKICLRSSELLKGVTYRYEPGSSVGLATDYGLNGPGSNPTVGRYLDVL